MASLFSDFLGQLGVRHTESYSDSRCASMPFQSMFGLSKLLADYGIPSEGVSIADKDELSALTPPFLADTPGGFVIVTSVGPGQVGYISWGEAETVDAADFKRAWNGVALLAYPDEHSVEPGYDGHAFLQFIDRAKKWALWALAAAIFAYFFVTNGIYRHWSTVALAAFDLLGLWLTAMLMQKTLKIKSKAADHVCGILQAGGCDSILELKASSFFGIFKWSEVGFAYFSVSLAALLAFPGSVGALALCNVCCLPFTVWSIWYQKFRAKAWCTLCVSVQCTLWLLFLCFLFGGWLAQALPLRLSTFVLAACYGAVLLAINRFDNLKNPKNDDETDTAS